MKSWAKLIGGLLAALLAAKAIITGHLSHWAFPAFGATGVTATLTGIALTIISAICLSGWWQDNKSGKS
jgi:hypothetical protein